MSSKRHIVALVVLLSLIAAVSIRASGEPVTDLFTEDLATGEFEIARLVGEPATVVAQLTRMIGEPTNPGEAIPLAAPAITTPVTTDPLTRPTAPAEVEVLAAAIVAPTIGETVVEETAQVAPGLPKQTDALADPGKATEPTVTANKAIHEPAAASTTATNTPIADTADPATATSTTTTAAAASETRASAPTSTTTSAPILTSTSTSTTTTELLESPVAAALAPAETPTEPWCKIEVRADDGVIAWEDDGDTAVFRRNGAWFHTPDDAAEAVLISEPINTTHRYVLRLWSSHDDTSRDVDCSFVQLNQTPTPPTTENSTTSTSSTAPATPSGSPVPIPRSGAYVGMNTGDENHGVTVEGREALLGHQMAIERIFYPPSSWTVNNININKIVRSHQAGRIPMVSYATKSWQDVASGKDDAIIDKLADQIKASKIPILLTIDHEPDEEACLNSKPTCGKGQTSQDFVNMWRRVHDRFEAKGVDNISWNWIVMGWQWGPYGNAERRQIIEDMFPGTAYVDWISADLYNDAGSCTYTPQQIQDKWSSLEANGQGWYDWASQFNKPLALGEWGTFDDVLQDGRKAQWLREARDTIKRWNRIKAVAYFDRNHNGCDWRLTTGGDEELAGYRELINDPYFIKG